MAFSVERALGTKYRIVIGTPWSDPEFVRLSYAHASEVWSDRKLRPDFAERMSAEQDAGRVLSILLQHAAGDEWRTVGYNILGQSENPLTGELVLGDWGFYIAPEHRRGRLAFALLEVQKQIAKAKGAMCYAGYVSCDNIRLQKLYEAAGFKKALIGFSWSP